MYITRKSFKLQIRLPYFRMLIPSMCAELHQNTKNEKHKRTDIATSFENRVTKIQGKYIWNRLFTISV